MKRWTLIFSLIIGMVLTFPAWAITLKEAARQAAKQHNARVLSAQTVENGNRRTHVIKLLTEDGVVKTVRIAAPPRKKRDR